jgi:catechol 2,3-dioxygenase-like lactoylglutathione lyase family enzyme
MTALFVQWTLDVHDVDVMARFWSEALGYRVDRDDGNVHLVPPAGSAPEALTVWLQASADPKRDKNRNHPDLVASDGDVEAEVERLVALGARHVDVGQTPDDPFVVLADPEGNEFCILRRRPRREPW